MTLAAGGDFTMDGRWAGVFSCNGSGGPASTALGGYTPPILKVGCAAHISVAGSFAMWNSAIVDYASAVRMELAGDFDNQSITPECFNWMESGLKLNGSTQQTFEVGGVDLGPVVDGFAVGDGTNFALGSLEVDENSEVRLVNEFANTAGNKPCTEALYVDHLILRPGAMLILEDCNVYYNYLVDEGGTIVTSGCGELLSTGIAPIPAVSEWGLVVFALLIVTGGTVVFRAGAGRMFIR
ncbi:MAG: hypothetical protein ACYTHJ_03470 [Planctomycetota bacterium]|jgi:hypothetical protein